MQELMGRTPHLCCIGAEPINVEPINSPQSEQESSWSAPTDLVADWEARRSTSQLLGIFIREHRRHYGLTVELFAHACNRSQEWLRSLERGEFIPTTEMLGDVSVGFSRSVEIDLDLVDVCLDLLGDPTSDLAEALRARVPASDSNVVDVDPESPRPGGAVPMSSSLSFFDRVLVVSPLAVGLLANAAVLGFAAWANGYSTNTLVTVPWVTFIGLAILSSTAFLVPTFNALFRPFTWLVRLPNKDKARDIGRWSEDYGPPKTVGTVWMQPGFSPYLQPRYRRDALDVGLAADFAERMTVVFAASFCFALRLCVTNDVFTLTPRFSTDLSELSRFTALAAALAILAALSVASARSSFTYGQRAHATIRDGLGIPRANSSKKDVAGITGASESASSQSAL